MPFVKRLLELKYNGKKLSEYKVIIEGSICVDKNYKGKGIAEEMHISFLAILKKKFDLVITEISDQNPRSLHVHKKKLGLNVIDEYKADGRNWYILIQKIKK